MLQKQAIDKFWLYMRRIVRDYWTVDVSHNTVNGLVKNSFGEDIALPKEDGFIFVIDMEPEANLTHPFYYVFVSDSIVSIKPSGWPLDSTISTKRLR